jgi:hypothetical protein
LFPLDELFLFFRHILFIQLWALLPDCEGSEEFDELLPFSWISFVLLDLLAIVDGFFFKLLDWGLEESEI